MKRFIILSAIFVMIVKDPGLADPPPQISGLVRTISLYENYLQGPDRFDTQTLSIYTLYSFRIGPEFLAELTMDINGDAPDDVYTDYYMELQLIKPVWRGLSVMIEDVQGTYTSRIVRFGVGYDF